MEQGKKRASRRRALAAASVLAVVALTAAACSSKSSTGTAPASGAAATGGSSSSTGGSIPTSIAPFAKYPAPSGGNGGSNGQIGLTATSINVGSPIAAGNGVSNAQIGTYLGAEAYYSMVNASGGIYGRKLNLTEMNTTFDPNVGLGVFTKYLPQMFAVNGSQSNVDAVAFKMVQSSGIPWVGEAFDPEFYALPNQVNDEPAVPYGTAGNGAYALYKAANPSISKVAIIWVNTAGIQPFVNSDVAGWKSVGVNTVYNVGVSGTVANLTPYVIQARAKGADVVDAFAVDITEAGRLAQAMQQQGWNPTLKTNYSIYDASWHQLAGSGAAGWQAASTYYNLPFLDDAALDATTGGKQFLYWVNKTASSQPLDVFTTEGWIQAAYFVQGLIKAGPELTRAKLLTALKGITNFNADGMSATFPSPAQKGTLPAQYCNNIEASTATGYTQIYPKTGNFGCVAQKQYTYPTGS
jgi:ABC-type branched-subunit amino acid transport system substrate-binding protein